MRDVFISYSHKDNLSLTDDQLGWVDRFHRALSVRLTQLLGRDSTMFYDKAVMSGSDILTPKIRSEVADARVLVSIVSPGYLQSAWCNEELSQFATAAATARLETGSTSRIIKVLKLPVEPQLEKLAKVDLSDVLGYKFYRTDQRGIASEFDLDDEPQNRREFVKRVNELAYDMRKILDMLGGEGMPNRAQVVAPTGKVVYVAETSFDLAGEREQLRSELAQYGHAVLPERDLSHGPQFADVAAGALAKADLSIHLVGAGYAAVPERERRSTVELQYDLATTERLRRPALRQLIWSPPNAVAEDERQREFLERLDEAAQRIIAPFDALKQKVHATLAASSEDVAPVAAQPAVRGAAGQASIYLIFDISDREAVQPLDDALFERGFDVFAPTFDGDEAAIRKHDERCLTECDAVLLFAASAPAPWLTQRAIDLQKAPAYGRTKPFLAQGVAMAAPRTADKDRFRRQSVVKIELYEGISASALEPFLAAIERARTAGG